MMVPRRTSGLRAAFTTVAALGAVAIGCIDRPVADVRPRTQSGVSQEIANEGIDKVDLLMMVDNSNSMQENQANIMRQFGTMISLLTNPPCRSRTDHSVPHHACDPNNPDDVPAYPPVTDLRVGIVSSDLGTPGSSVPNCNNSDRGDDGRLNPIRYGGALANHLPWVGAPPGFRPDDCMAREQFPAFITFDSARTDPAQFEHDFKCNAALYTGGCGIEQQLESVWRALVWHDARERPGNTSANAGFLRDDALLAIVMLTDEEDGSVRDCRFARGDACPPAGGAAPIDVFNLSSARWSHRTDLNLRMYMYESCTDQDPTWPLDRYVDPTNLSRGWMSLKPGHPERIVYAAITGVPLQVPTRTGTDGKPRTDWDALLGTPDPANRNNYCGRNTSTSVNTMSAEGPISMRQANQDVNCPTRTVPACRRQGSTYDPADPPCRADQQYFAWPGRRIVEIARRFDEEPMCNGVPCENGVVTSICSDDYAPAMQQIVEKIQSRLVAPCLPRQLAPTDLPDGTRTVQCVVREVLPEGESECDPSRNRSAPADMAARTTVINGVTRTVCEIAQVATRPDQGNEPVAGTGWFYDTRPDPTGNCNQRISFTENAAPVNGSVTRLECIQAVSGD